MITHIGDDSGGKEDDHLKEGAGEKQNKQFISG